MASHVMKLKGLVFALCCLSACDAEKTPTTSQSPPAEQATTQMSEKYTVALQATYPPFSSRNNQGEAIGLDVDLLNAIAEQQGFSLIFMPNTEAMAGLLNKLPEGSADMVPGIRFSEERMAKYDFSEPYLEDTWVALTKTNIKNFDELKNQKIAVQANSHAEKHLSQITWTNQAQPVTTVYLGVSELHKGNVAGVYDVKSVIQHHANAEKQVHMVEDPKSGTITFGIAIKKGNQQLKTKLDNGLKAIKANGTYQKIIDKWYPKNETAPASK